MILGREPGVRKPEKVHRVAGSENPTPRCGVLVRPGVCSRRRFAGRRRCDQETGRLPTVPHENGEQPLGTGESSLVLIPSRGATRVWKSQKNARND